MVFENEEINFPVNCHFKVITEDIQNMAFVIETVLMELKVDAPVVEGNKSTGGKYVTFNVTVRVSFKEEMNAIDAALRNIKGVKMVM